MANIVHLDELHSVDTRSTLSDFIESLKKSDLSKGSYFSGTIYLHDLPGNLRQAEVQGVVGYIISDMLVDMTLTSVDNPTRWTCTYRTGHGTPHWIERK